ncbi:MAG: carboxypeptidase-like regulatory domain-containing protein [Candidatus Aramenus sp.]|jgi:hypothetical protein|nr:carboxypeptidase-like regulatory domain-containing protein [Candidatus Aramenus sp.]
MNKVLLLGLGVLILVLTFAGVYLASGYKTTLTISTISTIPQDGNYVLEVKVIMNYGPFGGESPLTNAVVWVKGANGSFYQNYTNSDGIATFYLPPGSYTVEITQLGHYTVHVELNANKEVTLNYAYLYE